MLRYYELRSYLLLAMIINLKRRKSPVICSWMEAWIQNSLQNKTNAYNTNVKISDLMNIWGACHLFTLYLKGQWIKLNILLEVLASNEYVRRPGVTEQPIRGHFYDLTWWTWCLVPPLQFPDTRSSIATVTFSSIWKLHFILVDLVSAATTARLDRIIIVCTMSMEFQRPYVRVHVKIHFSTLIQLK